MARRLSYYLRVDTHRSAPRPAIAVEVKITRRKIACQQIQHFGTNWLVVRSQVVDRFNQTSAKYLLPNAIDGQHEKSRHYSWWSANRPIAVAARFPFRSDHVETVGDSGKCGGTIVSESGSMTSPKLLSCTRRTGDVISIFPWGREIWAKCAAKPQKSVCAIRSSKGWSWHCAHSIRVPKKHSRSFRRDLFGIEFQSRVEQQRPRFAHATFSQIVVGVRFRRRACSDQSDRQAKNQICSYRHTC